MKTPAPNLSSWTAIYYRSYRDKPQRHATDTCLCITSRSPFLKVNVQLPAMEDLTMKRISSDRLNFPRSSETKDAISGNRNCTTILAGDSGVGSFSASETTPLSETLATETSKTKSQGWAFINY